MRGKGSGVPTVDSGTSNGRWKGSSATIRMNPCGWSRKGRRVEASWWGLSGTEGTGKGSITLCLGTLRTSSCKLCFARGCGGATCKGASGGGKDGEEETGWRREKEFKK